MKLTKRQYNKIAYLFPVHRGNVVIENLSVLNAMLYILETGCKWRELPRRFGNWNTIYRRVNRWAKAGLWGKIFNEINAQDFIALSPEWIEAACNRIKLHATER